MWLLYKDTMIKWQTIKIIPNPQPPCTQTAPTMWPPPTWLGADPSERMSHQLSLSHKCPMLLGHRGGHMSEKTDSLSQPSPDQKSTIHSRKIC